MKKIKGIPFETILEKQLKDEEIRIAYDQRRFYLQVARLVSELREKKEWSQIQLAKAAKVSQPLIARLECGDQRRTPTFETISKILSALGYRMEITVQPEQEDAA